MDAELAEQRGAVPRIRGSDIHVVAGRPSAGAHCVIDLSGWFEKENVRVQLENGLSRRVPGEIEETDCEDEGLTKRPAP